MDSMWKKFDAFIHPVPILLFSNLTNTSSKLYSHFNTVIIAIDFTKLEKFVPFAFLQLFVAFRAENED